MFSYFAWCSFTHKNQMSKLASEDVKNEVLSTHCNDMNVSNTTHVQDGFWVLVISLHLSPNSSALPGQNYLATTIPSYMLDDYPVQKIVIAVFICVIAVVGIVGNTFIVVAVGNFQKLQTVTNTFITSLAVCNFMTCCTSPYHVTTILRHFPPKSNGLCVAVACILITTQIISLITLTMIAIHRVIFVRGGRRMTNEIYTRRNIAIMISISWILPAVIVTIASSVDFATLGYNVKYKTCIVQSNKSELASLVAGIVIGIPSFVIIVVCYTSIFLYSRKHHQQVRRSLSGEQIQANIKLRKEKRKSSEDVNRNTSTILETPSIQSRNNDTRGDNNLSSNGNSSAISTTTPEGSVVKRRKTITERVITDRQNKITRNLFLIVCVFVLCVMPFCIAIILPNANVVIPWFAVLLLSNSAINPILYGALHPPFRETFVKVLRCQFNEKDASSRRMSSFSNTSPRKRESTL